MALALRSSPELAAEAQLLITMGCGDGCPVRARCAPRRLAIGRPEGSAHRTRPRDSRRHSRSSGGVSRARRRGIKRTGLTRLVDHVIVRSIASRQPAPAIAPAQSVQSPERNKRDALSQICGDSANQRYFRVLSLLPERSVTCAGSRLALIAHTNGSMPARRGPPEGLRLEDRCRLRERDNEHFRHLGIAQDHQRRHEPRLPWFRLVRHQLAMDERPCPAGAACGRWVPYRRRSARARAFTRGSKSVATDISKAGGAECANGELPFMDASFTRVAA